MRYRDTGVDIDRGHAAVHRIRQLFRQFQPEVLNNVGRFGGVLPLPDDPGRCLVVSIDGVGTKTRVAAMVNRWDVCGRDVIAHGINDVLVQGVRAVFALDYLGMGRVDPDRVEAILRGMLEVCAQHGVALIGGETAEMPDVYGNDVDIVAVVGGFTPTDRLIDGQAIQPGDVVLGLASTGLHTNGYTLARKLFFERLHWSPDRWLEPCAMTLADALLQPHRCYLHHIWPVVERGWVHGIAHITGGGLIENIPRILPEGTAVQLYRDRWPVPPIFSLIQSLGEVPEDDMFRTFNMGIGMVVIVHPDVADAATDVIARTDCPVYRIGEVIPGDREVRWAKP